MTEIRPSRSAGARSLPETAGDFADPSYARPHADLPAGVTTLADLTGLLICFSRTSRLPGIAVTHT